LFLWVDKTLTEGKGIKEKKYNFFDVVTAVLLHLEAKPYVFQIINIVCFFQFGKIPDI